jgi:hypothetical protein
MSPDGLRGGGAGGEVSGRGVMEDRHPLDPRPPHHGVERVRSDAAELALRGEAHSAPGDERCYVPYYQDLLGIAR